MTTMGIILAVLSVPLLIYQWMAGQQRSRATWRLGWIMLVVGILFAVLG